HDDHVEIAVTVEVAEGEVGGARPDGDGGVGLPGLIRPAVVAVGEQHRDVAVGEEHDDVVEIVPVEVAGDEARAVGGQGGADGVAQPGGALSVDGDGQRRERRALDGDDARVGGGGGGDDGGHGPAEVVPVVLPALPFPVGRLDQAAAPLRRDHQVVGRR